MSFFEIGIEWKGIESVMKALDEANRAVQEATAQGVYEGALAVEATAKDLVPFDDSDLERSGQTNKDASAPASQPRSVVSFSTPYALRRHEEAPRMGVYDRWKNGKRERGYYVDGRGAGTRRKAAVDGILPGRKYLENALKLRTKQIMEHIARKVGDALGSRR